MSRPTVRLARPYTQAVQQIQPLPFSLRVAKTANDIERICAQRAQAYSRHQPDLVAKLDLGVPEKDDLRDDAVLLIAESHADGSVVGSMRLTTNINSPLRFENEFDLAPRFLGKPLLEAGRMTSRNGREGRLVVPALIKAAFEISYRTGIDYLLLIARPPIDRMYVALTFEDMFNGQRVETSAQPGVPVTLFYIDIPAVDTRLRQAQCPYYQFLAETSHPDLVIDHDHIERRFNVPRKSSSPAPEGVTSA
jgi:hypothetical protein